MPIKQCAKELSQAGLDLTQFVMNRISDLGNIVNLEEFIDQPLTFTLKKFNDLVLEFTYPIAIGDHIIKLEADAIRQVIKSSILKTHPPEAINQFIEMFFT
ncbi:MAG: hypothetical protein H0T62_10455 [Parachlamydiaceae bacterium]|nr:hypothetical protein [Parachlamydiaceae bacterium]